ncbi:RNA polymerase II transcription factor B subunit 1 [Phlyctochytrium planicorne]|nr:RNA polymerase II transcription factor B subunit 1 [Phlyctochytrium planicorne]
MHGPDTVLDQQVNVNSAKVLLKITQWAQQSQAELNFNFQFVGKDANQNRERVKEVINLEISKNRVMQGGAMSQADIQVRQTLLTKNKELGKLHKDLVLSGLLSEEEFWQNRQSLLITQAFALSQKKGTSSGSLADVKPSADGSDLKYTLTPDIKHSIFIQYPSVQKAFAENVPTMISEKDFWQKFFASKYFHKTRLPGQVTEVDDLFKKYLVEDEDDALPVPKKQKKDIDNRFIDLSATAEDHLTEYGNTPDFTMKAGNFKSSLPVLRRYNRHSEVVLKSQSSAPVKPIPVNAESEINIDDLNKETDRDQNIINIQDPHKYFESHAANGVDIDTHVDNPKVLLDNFSSIVKSWTKPLSEIKRDEIRSDQVAKRLHSQTKRDNQAKLNTTVVPDDIANIHRSSCELLRHFWQSKTRPDQRAEETRQIKLREGIEAYKTMIMAESKAPSKLLENVLFAMEKV